VSHASAGSPLQTAVTPSALVLQTAHPVTAAQPSESHASAGSPLQSAATPSNMTPHGVPVGLSGEQDPLILINSSEIDSYVSDQMKEKIWNSKYVDLALLLKSNVQNDTDNHLQLTFTNDQLMLKPQSKVKRIENIDTWTDAFINYALIYIQKHQARASEIFKYMAIVRGAAQLNPFGSCYQYDMQFRLRMANDPSRSWSNIDGHLWITCSLFGTSSVPLMPKPRFEGPCYDFNYKGGCFRTFCKYAHSCIICRVAHPVVNCTKSNTRNAVPGSGDVTFPQSRPQFGKRFPPENPNRFNAPATAPQMNNSFRSKFGKRYNTN
jgi:hypothetical protein